MGFDVVFEARDVPGWGTTGDILFLAAGGYHHHLGFNTWKSAGGSPQPDGVAGLHPDPTPPPTRPGPGAAPPRAATAPAAPAPHPPPTAPQAGSTSPPPPHDPPRGWG